LIQCDEPLFEFLQFRHGRSKRPCRHLTIFVGWTHYESYRQLSLADIDSSAPFDYRGDLDHAKRSETTMTCGRTPQADENTRENVECHGEIGRLG
jgi:hypothetical protein